MYFIIGLLGNFYYSSINSIVTILNKEKTKALFKLESFYQIGAFIGPIVGGALALKSGGMKMAFYVWVVLGIIGFFLSYFLKNETSIQKKNEKQPDFKILLKELGSDKWNFLLYLIVGGFLTGFFESVIALAAPLYLTSINFDIAKVGIIIGFGCLFSVFGLLVLGRFMDRMGHKKALIITCFLVTISSIVFIISNNVILLIIMFGLFTVGRAGGLNVTRSYISSNVAEELRATGMSINDIFCYLARIIGPIIAGLLIDFRGAASPFIICFIVGLLATLLMIFKDNIFHLLNLTKE
jgi:MFS family permease